MDRASVEDVTVVWSRFRVVTTCLANYLVPTNVCTSDNVQVQSVMTYFFPYGIVDLIYML